MLNDFLIHLITTKYMNGEIHYENNNLLKEYWAKDSDAISAMLEQGVAGYIKKLPEIDGAFVVTNEMCGCIDEGLDGDLNLAGSGILLPEDELRETFLKMKDAGLRVITSHDGCGAAGIYAKEHGISVDEAMKYNEERLSRLAEELGLEYEHIPGKDMSRPLEMHTARVIYVDGTGGFNPEMTSGLPKGFGISRTYLKKDYALEEIKVSIGIALGNHGFGNQFTEEQPLIIIPIGGDSRIDGIALEELKKELEVGLVDLLNQYGKRIKIDGFEAPKKNE